MSHVVGLDLSLTAAGIVTDEGEDTIKALELPSRPSELDRLRRLHKHVAAIDARVVAEEAELIVVEGYSYGSKFSRETMGELGGAVRLCLYQRGLPFTIIPPKRLKKWATNDGNASKEKVLIAAIRETAASHFDIGNNNEADAFFLWQMGTAFLTGSLLPKYRKEVLESVDWPPAVKREVLSGKS